MYSLLFQTIFFTPSLVCTRLKATNCIPKLCRTHSTFPLPPAPPTHPHPKIKTALLKFLYFLPSRAFHGDLNEVKKSYPSTFEQPLEMVHKLGFPDVILPGLFISVHIEAVNIRDKGQRTEVKRLRSKSQGQRAKNQGH